MSNPWLKKNPFLSLWLSGANKVAGTARGQLTAEMNRQTRAVAAAMVKEMTPKVGVASKPAGPARKRPANARKRA